jgi:hypothetical protein
MNSFIIFLSFIPLLTIYSHQVKNTNIHTNINVNTNFCKNCKNFYLDNPSNHFELGLCKLFYDINLITGVKNNILAFDARYNGECGKIGYFYEPYNLEDEIEKNNIKY